MTQQQQYTPYFSVRMREKLREALDARSVLVEALLGYGKTTVIQDGLRTMLVGDAVFIRHVCEEESPRAAWRRLCRTLQKIDLQRGAALLRLDLPDEDSFGEVAELLREMECSAPTWLALDDFHLIAELAPFSVWKAFLEHDSPLLHLTLMTRPLAESVMPYEKAGFLRLTENDLRLTERESGEFFADAGVRLSTEQTRELYRRCEGWAIALSLHLQHYSKKGDFAPASATGLSGLLRDAVWDGLDEDGRDFLLRLSPFEAWTEEQAAYLFHLPELPVEAVARLHGNSFIRFDPDSGLYAPHGALLEFTREMRKRLPKARQRAILSAAADWCAGNGERAKAIALYYELRDFEKILALDLSGLEDNRMPVVDPKLTYIETLRAIMVHCDRDRKIRYPMSMIQLAFEFFGQGCHKEFTALCEDMAGLIGEIPADRDANQGPMPPEAPPDAAGKSPFASEAERNRLRGELLLLESFTKYNSIAEMGRRMKAAAELTGGRPSLISPDNSWTFGNASILLMYHSEVGRLDAELADMDTYCPYYVALTEGHGSGGAALMQAEALFCRGGTAEAEIFCRKARYEAGLRGQTSVVIGADLLLGRLAILRGKGNELAAVLERLTRQARENPQKSDRMEAGMALAFLDGLLMRPASAAEWLLEGSPASLESYRRASPPAAPPVRSGQSPEASFARRLFTQAIPYAHLCRERLLLLAGQPEPLLGEAGAVRDAAEKQRYPLAVLYSHIHCAAAWNMLGEHGKAGIELRKALDMALADGLLMPLAENSDFLLPVLDSLNRGRPRKGLRRIIALCKAWKTNVMPMRRRFSVYARPLRAVLTPKQLEQAIMGADGKTYKDIAVIRGVSSATVKRIYANIYARTGVNDRETLRALLEEQRLIAGSPAR